MAIMTHWSMILETQHLIGNTDYQLVNEAQICQHAVAFTAVGMPSVNQLPGGLNLNINWQTLEGVSIEFCLMPLYQTININYTHEDGA